MRVQIINNARCEKHGIDFYNNIEAFEYIKEKILLDDQATDQFEANDWGEPFELTLDKFVDEFSSRISVGDYTYSFIIVE